LGRPFPVVTYGTVLMLSFPRKSWFGCY